MVTAKRVEDESLIRLGDLGVSEPALVREVHLRRDRARVQPGRLRVQLEVDRLRGLDADHELVARDVLEDALRDVLELDAHFDLGLVQGCVRTRARGQASQSVCVRVGGSRGSRPGEDRLRIPTFAGLEDEGHALPPRVVDPERGGRVRWADGVGWDGVVIEIAGLSISRDILPEQRVAALDGWDRTEHLDLYREGETRICQDTHVQAA